MKNMLKILSLSLATTAMVTTTDASAKSFQGFYVGGSAGYSQTRLKTDESVSIPAENFFEKGSSKLNSGGAAFELSAGYGWVFGSGFYLGVEAGLGYENLGKKRNSSGTFETPDGDEIDVNLQQKLKSGLTVAGSLRIGYVFCGSTLVYGLVGVQSAPKWKHKLEADIDGEIKSLTGSVKRCGILLGLGGRYLLKNGVYFGVEGRYLTGHKHTKTSNLGAGTLKVKHKSPTYTGLVSVGYQF